MLDTYGRKYINPFIEFWVKIFEKMTLTPTQVTIIAFLVGGVSILSYGKGYVVVAVILLWFSGLLDAVDGALARKTGQISKWGTLLDITFDRLVEVGMLVMIAVLNPHGYFAIILVLSSIIFSMTVFLTVGALSENNGKKSFRYQAGLAERTEGFLFISFMMIFNNHVQWIGYGFTALIVITAVQRLYEAKKVFDD